MKSIVCMIREIFKMQNQYTVDNPTLPVNVRFHHLFQILAECEAVLWECQAAAIGQAFGTRMVYRESFLQIQQRLLQHLIRKSQILGSLMYQNTSSGSEMPVRTVSQNFIRPLWGKTFKGLWGRPTTTADFRSSFRQSPHASNVRLLEDKIQDWGMYLLTISYGSYALYQRSGDQWMI